MCIRDRPKHEYKTAMQGCNVQLAIHVVPFVRDTETIVQAVYIECVEQRSVQVLQHFDDVDHDHAAPTVTLQTAPVFPHFDETVVDCALQPAERRSFRCRRRTLCTPPVLWSLCLVRTVLHVRPAARCSPAWPSYTHA